MNMSHPRPRASPNHGSNWSSDAEGLTQTRRQTHRKTSQECADYGNWVSWKFPLGGGVAFLQR